MAIKMDEKLKKGIEYIGGQIDVGIEYALAEINNVIIPTLIGSREQVKQMSLLMGSKEYNIKTLDQHYLKETIAELLEAVEPEDSEEYEKSIEATIKKLKNFLIK